MGKRSERIQKRKKTILAFLPTYREKGKTYEEIAEKTEYCVATVRGDLNALKEKGDVECDDRRPFKWYKILKEKK